MQTMEGWQQKMMIADGDEVALSFTIENTSFSGAFSRNFFSKDMYFQSLYLVYN